MREKDFPETWNFKLSTFVATTLLFIWKNTSINLFHSECIKKLQSNNINNKIKPSDTLKKCLMEQKCSLNQLR